MKEEPFIVMAKPVGSTCNLECKYCYYLDTELEPVSLRPSLMPDSLLESYIQQYIEASQGPIIPFSWHGGEPTLAGLEFYRHAVKLQKQYLPKGWGCWNNLQTNGMLINGEWCRFLADEHFDIGISIDGTELLHNENRKDLGGLGTYHQAVSAVRLMQSHGIQPDILCTVTSSIAKEPIAVYHALRDLNTGWIQFIPIVRHTTEGQLTKESVTSDDYGDFLCTIFDDWSLHDLGRTNIQMFSEMMLVHAGGTSSLCWMAPTCGRVLILEHNGSVYSCDHFVTSKHKIGDIKSSSLSVIANTDQQKHFGSRKRDSLSGKCQLCPWLKLCNGGCLKDRILMSENGLPELNYLCSGLSKFFAHSDQPLKLMIQYNKQGLRSEAIMSELHNQALRRWRGIERNSPCPCGSGRKAKHCCWWKRP